MKFISYIYPMFFSFLTLNAQYFDWNEACDKAYDKIYKFEFSEATHILNTAIDNNRVGVLLNGYIDFFKIIAQEKEEDIKRFYQNSEKREKLLLKAEENAYKKFIQAEIAMQTGFIKLKKEEYLSAFWDIKKAYNLYLENEKTYPKFSLNKKGIGILEIIIGSIPNKYQWGVKMVGLNGDLNSGVQKMKDFIYNSPTHAMQQEAKLIYVMVQYFIEHKTTTANNIIRNELKAEDGIWQCMTIANIAEEMGDNDFAIATLEKCPKSANAYPFPVVNLKLGVAKLNRLDTDSEVYLRRFIEKSIGNTYKKEGYLKLAWYALINNNTTAYETFRQKAITEGTTQADEDKQAMQEAQQNFTPNINLLKARLLFDGAYYQRALSEMEQVNPMLLNNEKEQVEYNYRYGRILQNLARYDEAITIFDAIVASENWETSYYFAPKALLELGGIYEGRKEYKKAKYYYQQVKNYTQHPYVNSFEQQAKSSIKRIEAY